MPGTNSSLEGRFVWVHGVKDFSLRCAGSIAGIQQKAGYNIVAVGVIGRPAPPCGGLETDRQTHRAARTCPQKPVLSN